MYPESAIYLVSSGTAALTLALGGLPVPQGKNEVVIPAYTCPSVAAAVIQSGFQPVLCDLRPEGFQLAENDLEAKIRPETAAVVAVHLFGIPQEMRVLKDLAQRSGAFVIEDACQAFGNRLPSSAAYPSDQALSETSGRFLGGFGDLGILSFGRGKPLSLMSGGAVVINNPECEPSLRARYDALSGWGGVPQRISYFVKLMLYAWFFHPRMYWIPSSLPWLGLGETNVDLDFPVEKADPALIRLGAFLRQGFEKDRQHRLALAGQYTACLEDLRDAFLYMPRHENFDLAFLRYPVVFRETRQRDAVLSELKQQGLGATPMYPVPLSRQEGISAYLPEQQSPPGAIRVAEGMMTLPLHSFVSSADVGKICKIIERYV